MSRNTICHACERGDHKRHRRIVQAVSEGMLGGSVCVCQGECADGRYKKTLDQLLGLKPGIYERMIDASSRGLSVCRDESGDSKVSPGQQGDGQMGTG